MQTLTLRQRFSLARFLRGLGPEAGPVQLDRSRIFILPTATGLLFAVVLLVMLLGAINYANNMGYMFTFLLGSMALVSILHSYRNLAQLQFAAGRAEPVFAGERAAFDIHVGNPAPRCTTTRTAGARPHPGEHSVPARPVPCLGLRGAGHGLRGLPAPRPGA